MSLCKENHQPVPILLYIPVLHRGYLEFFSRYPKSRELWLIGDKLVSEFSALHGEIRAISPMEMQTVIYSLGRFNRVGILGRHTTKRVSFDKIITASDSVSIGYCKKYFPRAKLVVDSVFLRYDQNSVKTLTPVGFDRESCEQYDIEMMAQAFNESEKSSDWWRHVGSVLVKDGKVVFVAHNHPVPSEHMPYVFGNPRDFIEAGKMSQFSDAMHSEKDIFAQALRAGISTYGADLYVSVFPCPDCAKLIAYSGIKRLFFGSGHASLDGQSVLKSQGVELVYVPIGSR